MRRPFYFVFAALLVLSVVLSACAPVAAPTSAPAAEATQAPVTEATQAPVAEATQAEQPTAEVVNSDDPSMLEGDIYSAGSSTVGPLSEAIQELFTNEGFPGQIKNDIVGSGAGFERFCTTGETDVANASRAIKDGEVANCRALSPAREPIPFLVGLDAIAVVINKDNDFAKDVTLEQLQQLFTSAELWSDVDPSWPAEPILRYTPGTDSGTFDFFVEVVVQKPNKIEKLDEAKALALEAKNLNQSEDDNVLVQGVEGNKYAIGYFGYAYYQEESERLGMLTLDGVTPSQETAEDGSYKLARPLFIYSDAEILKSKPQVAAFVRFYLENVNSVISEVGYFPASEEALAESVALLDYALYEMDPSALEGDIYTAGSSTVGPLSEAIQELFTNEGFPGQIKNDIVGSGAGFERFCKTGETDVANASRAIKDGEVENCRALSPAREPIPFLVGLDAIAVVINKDNDFAKDVTLEQLQQLFTSAEMWSDVDPSWPAEPILRYTPGTDSGTFDFFVEVVVQKPKKIEKLDEAKALALEAKNLNQSEDDNVLVQGVEGNKYAIGYFGYAYYQEESERLGMLTVNGVTPSQKTAEDGSYVLARPLFIYSDAEILQVETPGGRVRPLLP